MSKLKPLISALMDGELADGELARGQLALSRPEGRAAWRAYRLIGEALRAGADGPEPSAGFSARLAARLEAAEPHSAQPEPAGS